MAGESILIVDDSRDIRILLEEDILPAMGFRVASAGDGQAGLEMAERFRPDLILLDMNMPRMSGLEMLAELRRRRSTAPAILMTAYGSEHVAIEAFRLGVRDYLVKPFTHDEILASIDRALNELRLARAQEELNRNLMTAEIVRITVVTLSHYLNNHLTTLKGGLTLLSESLAEKAPDPYLMEILRSSRKSALSIQSVMKVLLDSTGVRLCDYTDTTKMMDIESALREELSRQGEFAEPEGWNALQPHT
ncbi:MAG: response regulator [Anaerolineales bacterium]|nr:response regulator [Anaerolineales bacterium]